MNKLGRGWLGEVSYQNQGSTLCLVVLDKKVFHVSPYIRLCKTCDPGAEPFLATGVYFEKKIGRGPQGDTTY